MSYQNEERFIALKQYTLADSRITINHESGNVLINIRNISKNKSKKTHYWISSELGETNHRDPNDWLARFGVNLSPFASDLADYPKENSLQIVSLQETHLVLFGETLWSIAKKHQTTVTWLKKLNHLPSDHIKSGTVLLLT
ncbi:MAG: LysM peptidoglycan-binding domain-containing protein, partial [Carnobacterium sp.]